MLSRITRSALIVPLLLLGGCGFQLRGAEVLPPQLDSLYVQAPTELRNEVEIFLQGARTELLDEREGASLVLRMDNPRYDRRVLSVDPDTGKEREFEISYRVNFSAARADGTAVVAPRTLTVLRDYVFDSDAVIGKSREEGVLRVEMRRDAVQQILYQLRAATIRG